MNRRVRVASLVMVCIIGVWFLWRVRKVFTPLLLAVIMAYLLLPTVELLERRRVPRGLAILIIYAFAASVGGALLSLLIPYLAEEINALVTAFPQQTQRLEGLTLDLLDTLRDSSLPAAVREAVESVATQIERSLAAMLSRLLGGVVSVFTSVFYLILAPVLAFFLMRDWPIMKRSVLGWFPPEHHTRLLLFGRRVDDVLSGFVRGQLIISFIIGLIIAGGLALLGVRYALVVGLIAGAFNVVPYFGPVIGGVPAVVLALIESPTTALWTVALFFGVNQLESAVLSPKVVGDLVGLHPVTVIFAILAGAELWGLLGMLLAVPLTAVLKVSGESFFEWLVGSTEPV